MKLTSLLAVTFVAVGLVACGGDDKKAAGTPAPSKTATPAGDAPASETNTPKLEEPGAEEADSNVEKVRKALDDAGINVTDEDVSGTATASLDADGTSIVFYRNSEDAAEEGAAIAKVFKGKPGRGLVEIKETRVYYTAQERDLRPSEKSAFQKVIDAAEAAL